MIGVRFGIEAGLESCLHFFFLSAREAMRQLNYIP